MEHFAMVTLMSRSPACLWVALGFAVAAQATPIPDQIDSILLRSTVVNNAWTILVENKDGSVIYYQRNPTLGQAPASNTKIFTSSAAFGLLGTNYTVETRIYRDGTVTGGV